MLIQSTTLAPRLAQVKQFSDPKHHFSANILAQCYEQYV
jgi:hypothetical protein